MSLQLRLLGFIWVVAHFGLVTPGCAEPPVNTDPQTTATYTLPDIGFEFEAPDGFKLTKGLWYHKPFRASFQFAVGDGQDYDKVAAEFTEPALKSQGQKLLGKSEVEVNGGKGTLVSLSYTSSGAEKLGWIIVFPDKQGVCQVTTITQKDQPKSVQDALVKALLTVKRIKKS